MSIDSSPPKGLSSDIAPYKTRELKSDLTPPSSTADASAPKNGKTSSDRPPASGPSDSTRPGTTDRYNPDGSLKKPLPKHAVERCTAIVNDFIFGRESAGWMKRKKKA